MARERPEEFAAYIGSRQSAEIQREIRRQPAMDLSRDKNAEEMKWSPLEMGAAMQAHGA